MKLAELKLPKDALELTHVKGADEEMLAHVLQTRKQRLTYGGKYVSELMGKLGSMVIAGINIDKFAKHSHDLIQFTDHRLAYAPREKALYLQFMWKTPKGELRSELKLELNMHARKVGFGTMKLLLSQSDSVDITKLVAAPKHLFRWR